MRTPQRTTLLAGVAGLALAGLLTATDATALAVAPGASHPHGDVRADRAAATNSGHLDPILVRADGTFDVDVANPLSALADVDLSILGDAGGLLGSGALDLPGGAQSPTSMQLTATGLSSLVDRTWMDVTVSGTVAGLPVAHTVELIAPSYTTADPANPGNPLAGRPWATYTGDLEWYWPSYEHATGTRKDLLARMALVPKARWFVSNAAPRDLGRIVHQYVESATAEDPDALVQLTMFTLDPWENAACEKLPTRHEIALDRAYTKAFVRGIGSAHAAVVVEPDGPYAGCEPHHAKVLAHLVGDAVHQLAQLPNTSAYIDMGSADWHRGEIGKEIPLLMDENIQEARGFSMDVTHTDFTSAQIIHARKLIRRLDTLGVHDKHAVIDTSDNGRAFGGAEWRVKHPAVGPWAAPSCHSASQKLCVSLGIPPTTDVANPRWGLSPLEERLAAKYVDGYLWIKRPWLDPFHHYDFSMRRALDEIRTSPYL